MRDIKFRAWDKKKKEIFQVHQIEWNYVDNSIKNIEGYTGDSGGWRNVYGGGNMKYASEDRFVLMQYTGFKDENGNEIYDGDVLKYFFKGERLSGNVSFENGLILVTVLQISNDAYTLLQDIILDDDFYLTTVVGNIYENPELLEVEDA